MNNWNMDDFGRDVRSSIQDAINSGDFSRLNRNINDSMSRVFYGTTNNGMPPDIKLSNDGQQNNAYNMYHEANTSNFGAGTSHMRREGTYTDVNVQPVQFIYRPVKSQNVISKIEMIFGYFFGGVMLLAALLALVEIPKIGMTNGFVEVATDIIMSVPFLAVGFFGSRRQKRYQKFMKYQTIIGNRQVCNVSELAERTGRPDEEVVKDLNKFIDKGWFCQGHMDNSQKSLMLTNKAYGEYREIMEKRQEQQQDQAAKEAAEQARHGHLDPEVRQLIQQGEEYIATIRRVNDQVPGEEVSAKMYKMEDLVRRIFERVEEKPEQAGDLKRLMNYYLPTSIKLLEAYADMDKQDVPGENILKSKREIEETLDTLNVAYEKFLDDMFRDTAWDVSSDVSVLKTMLAREGLTKNDFDR